MNIKSFLAGALVALALLALVAAVPGAADQRYRGPWEKQKQVTARNATVASLRVTNKSASTVWIQVHDSADGAGAPETDPEEYPLPSNSTLSVVNLRYNKGVFVKAVGTPSGALISANDIKIQVDYMIGPR